MHPVLLYNIYSHKNYDEIATQVMSIGLVEFKNRNQVGVYS